MTMSDMAITRGGRDNSELAAATVELPVEPEAHHLENAAAEKP